MKNSILTYRVLSVVYLSCFVGYLLVNALFSCCVGVERIIDCTYHWTLFNKPEDGGCYCLCQFLQGFFIAVFLVIVAPVSFFLFLGNLCCPRQQMQGNPYGNNYNVGSA